MNQAQRAASLLPNNTPKYVRCYIDYTHSSADYITVVFTGRYRHKTGGEIWARAMSGKPFHPQGIGLMCFYRNAIDTNRFGYAPALGRKNHLGTRVEFSKLPEDCQTLVLRDYKYLWDLEETEQ